MNYLQNTDCREWQFKNIPPFEAGKMMPYFVDCGVGRGVDFDEAQSSFMHTFSDICESDIKKYAEKLGVTFTKTFENTMDGNLFYQYETPEGLLFVSFLKNDGTARIILDRCEQTPLNKFGYSKYEETKSDTIFSQYSLHYDKMISGTSSDCGMNFVFRLHDNSLFIIDGGEFEQATDVAVADYLKFLHELTGTRAGEKLRISFYLCTHAHDDHCDFMSKLLRFHADEMEIERVAFNFPNGNNIRNSPSCAMFKERMAEKFPEAQFVKLHAGSSFNIANTKLTVLLSAEDTIGTEDENIFPGTNETSIIFDVYADGNSILFLADCGDKNGRVLVKNYEKSTLECDILQGAHHGINEIIDVYRKIKTKVILLAQSKMTMDTRFSENYENFCNFYGEENIRMAHDATDIFTLENGSFINTKRAHVGTIYDGSEW